MSGIRKAKPKSRFFRLKQCAGCLTMKWIETRRTRCERCRDEKAK